MTFGISKAGEIGMLSLFTFAALFIYLATGFLLFAATISAGATGIFFVLLMLAWIAIGAIAFFRFLFTPFFMAIDGLAMKKALSQSWKWSEKKVFSIIALFFALGIVSYAINAAFGAISGATGIEAIAFAALALGFCLSNAYYNTVLAKYFIESRQ